MANILKRFSDIMSANINALLDKAEDPEKMIDEYMRDIQDDLRKVKAETAAVMAHEKQALRKLNENKEEADKYQKYAEKALIAGNEADAKAFLTKKAALVNNQAGLQQIYDASAANAKRMKDMHDKLEKDMISLNDRKEQIKSKMAVAKAQEKINKMTSNSTTGEDSMAAFNRMEAKANRLLDEADAMAELNESGDSVEDLAAKYDEPTTSDPAVDDELAAMKAKLGL